MKMLIIMARMIRKLCPRIDYSCSQITIEIMMTFKATEAAIVEATVVVEVGVWIQLMTM